LRPLLLDAQRDRVELPWHLAVRVDRVAEHDVEGVLLGLHPAQHAAVVPVGLLLAGRRVEVLVATPRELDGLALRRLRRRREGPGGALRATAEEAEEVALARLEVRHLRLHGV